jgi:putative oxidoreductase
MKIVALTCRIFLGLLFVVFGANGLHPFMPTPPIPPGPMLDWMNIMMNSHWLTVVAFFQVVGGLLVLAGGTLPLGLCILCPITINIWCFHMLLTAGRGTGPAIFATILELLLIYYYRASFAGILTVKAKPV